MKRRLIVGAAAVLLVNNLVWFEVWKKEVAETDKWFNLAYQLYQMLVALGIQ